MPLLGLGLVLVSLALFHGVCTKSVVENLAVECNLDGTFTVYLSGDIWFRCGAVGVRADGSWRATDEKTLEVIIQTTNQGNDTIGEFTSYEYTWKAVSNASAFDLHSASEHVHQCVHRCPRAWLCLRSPTLLQPSPRFTTELSPVSPPL